MKKRLVLFLITIVFSISGCSSFKGEDKSTKEMIAYQSLTTDEQKLIEVSPKDSKVEKVKVTNEMKEKLESSYRGESVYSVIFNDTNTKEHGELVVYLDEDGKSVVGKGYY
ncbi:hypothetical protein [Bacillus sp. 179-C3.3 HS]|uniref:hypothetical protein n=1 Tax=Bacillus sp. 179-C3.3 HS TaxID=3232162 RepID=UPI00399F199E